MKTQITEGNSSIPSPGEGQPIICLSKWRSLYLAMLPGKQESRKWLNKQLCTSYCLNRISIRAICRRILFFGVLFASNQVNKEVELQPASVPWEHISTIISPEQSKRRQSSLLEKHYLFLNVIFLCLMSLAPQFSFSEVAATTAQAKPKYLDSLQFWKSLLSIHEKNYSRRYVSQKQNSRKTLPKANVQSPSYPALTAWFLELLSPFFPSKKILSTNFFWGEKHKWKIRSKTSENSFKHHPWCLGNGACVSCCGSLREWHHPSI